MADDMTIEEARVRLGRLAEVPHEWLSADRCADLRALLDDHARLAGVLAAVAEDLGHPSATAAEAVRRCGALLVAGDAERERLTRQRDAAEEALAAAHPMLAEVERLRSLPVIETCGDCGYEGQEWCGAADRETSPTATPPSWCPLRGGR